MANENTPELNSFTIICCMMNFRYMYQIRDNALGLKSCLRYEAVEPIESNNSDNTLSEALAWAIEYIDTNYPEIKDSYTGC